MAFDQVHSLLNPDFCCMCKVHGLLTENLCLMCISHDREELDSLYQSAKAVLDSVYAIRKENFLQGQEAHDPVKPVLAVERCVFCGQVISGKGEG